jgi:hypothetical protein
MTRDTTTDPHARAAFLSDLLALYAKHNKATAAPGLSDEALIGANLDFVLTMLIYISGRAAASQIFEVLSQQAHLVQLPPALAQAMHGAGASQEIAPQPGGVMPGTPANS